MAKSFITKNTKERHREHESALCSVRPPFAGFGMDVLGGAPVLSTTFLFTSLACMLLGACGANSDILKSGKESPTPSNTQPAKNSFERELQEFRTADFFFVYVLRRRDGGPIDSEDRVVIKANTNDVNRRVLADDGKAFILGSNSIIQPQNMAALNARFAVEDHSPPTAQAVNANVNSNTNK